MNAPTPDTLVTLAAAFDHAARGVRRAVLLARSLDRPAPPAPDPAAHRAAARRRVLREVEDTIQRPGHDGRGGPALPGSLQEGLRAELRDRLDGPDLDDDITSRPAADIITEILRDLGLGAHPGTRPFQRRTPDDLRRLCARAAAPSAARQPGAESHGLGPEDPGQNADQRLPDLQRDNPAATLRTQPGPTYAGSDLPDDPAEAIATILRHHTSAQARWRPPPEA